MNGDHWTGVCLSVENYLAILRKFGLVMFLNFPCFFVMYHFRGKTNQGLIHEFGLWWAHYHVYWCTTNNCNWWIRLIFGLTRIWNSVKYHCFIKNKNLHWNAQYILLLTLWCDFELKVKFGLEYETNQQMYINELQ